MATPFTWSGSSRNGLPILEDHSRTKLRILQEYIELYIKIVFGSSFRSHGGKITLIDGFAGGGIYKDNEAGSPLVMIEAVRSAEIIVNAGRRIPTKIDAQYWFVEKDPDAFACLDGVLRAKGYASQIGKNIFMRQGCFEDYLSEILTAIKKRHPREGGRAIFFLDQCGYSKVTIPTLAKISRELHGKAEFIINFAVDWLERYAHDGNNFRQAYSNLGLTDVNVDDLLALKDSGACDWQYLVEAKLAPAIVRESGAKFYSPFYIRPASQRNGYWLLHLAPHARARAAMTDVHWANSNGSIHYGNLGLNMLAYKPDINPSAYLTGLSFTEATREATRQTLSNELAKQAHARHQNGVTLKELFESNCNGTIANRSLFEQAVLHAKEAGDVKIVGPGGGKKQSSKLQSDDVIYPERQTLINF
jgi:three-Cys-motif partner protein